MLLLPWHCDRACSWASPCPSKNKQTKKLKLKKMSWRSELVRAVGSALLGRLCSSFPLAGLGSGWLCELGLPGPGPPSVPVRVAVSLSPSAVRAGLGLPLRSERAQCGAAAPLRLSAGGPGLCEGRGAVLGGRTETKEKLKWHRGVGWWRRGAAEYPEPFCLQRRVGTRRCGDAV